MDRIVFPLNMGMQGSEVAALQEAIKLLVEKGGLKLDAVSQRKIATLLRDEMASRRYGSATSELVKIFQEEQRLKASGEVDRATAETLMARLVELGIISRHDPPDDKRDTEKTDGDDSTATVSGRVFGRDLQGLPDVRVRLIDRNVGRDVVLGESQSGEGGYYQITYATGKLPPGKSKPDLQALAIDRDGAPLAESDIRYNASVEEFNLDIPVPEGKIPRQAEFKQLVIELAPHLGMRDANEVKKVIAEIKEDETRQDVTYLANKSGWDARMVAMLSLAGKFGQESGIEPEFYYALFRAGIPANESALLQLEPSTVQNIWDAAVENEILPAELAKHIPESLERFVAHHSQRLLDSTLDVGVSSFREIIADALPDEKNQQYVAQLYYERRERLDEFWSEVRKKFPKEAELLQLDGKLAHLTMNNAPLIRRLHSLDVDIKDPVDLVQRGLYREETWEKLLVDDMPIPNEIPGEDERTRRSNYAKLLSGKLRLSYPTAVVAAMIQTGEIPVPTAGSVRTEVARFLHDHQGRFELGIHPIERYLKQEKLELKKPVLEQLKAVQRVYQISPTDETMGALLESGLNSAYSIVRYDQNSFLQAYGEKLGGEESARLVYAKAHQVHHAVLNVALTYMIETSAPRIYSIQATGQQVTDDTSSPAGSEHTGVLAYPTLQSLFGEMDYCTCEHCRSWLSPAAYLVDLLLFLDRPVSEKENPLDVLLQRRPDIEHLELSCENTNTVLPYIDLVNEILEHYVVNGTIDGFTGHNTGTDVTTEELLANPQFVNEKAYEELLAKIFPIGLPFHQPLEALRRYVHHFELPLHEVMEVFRTSDDLRRSGDETATAYGWHDILMERLQLSRPEFKLLTDGSIPLNKLFGEDTTSLAEVLVRISNAKTIARKLQVSLEQLIELTRTRFINPESTLIPKIESLGITFAVMQQYIDGKLSDSEFEALLPDDLDPSAYGGNLKKWLTTNVRAIMRLIVLAEPDGSMDPCGFDTVELRYSLPDFDKNRLREFEFVKLMRFVRLQKKLGWSIEHVDKAFTALYPQEHMPAPDDSDTEALRKLDRGLEMFLFRLAQLKFVMERLEIPQSELIHLLACWSTIDTHGTQSLYRRMFLNPTVQSYGTAFEPDAFGNYLSDPDQKLLDHIVPLCAAFNLTRESFDRIVAELGYDAETPLDLEHISAIYRYGYLAKKLRLSVQELIALIDLSGLDPFQPLDMEEHGADDGSQGNTRPQIVQLLDLLELITSSPLSVHQLLFLFQHIDIGGKTLPSAAEVLSFARMLRRDLRLIEQEHTVGDDPTGDMVRNKLSMVYGNDAVDLFSGLLNSTVQTEVNYAQGDPELTATIRERFGRLSYDHLRKKLKYRGVMTEEEKAAFIALPEVTTDFKHAVEELHRKGQDSVSAFFDRYPELQRLYENFFASTAEPGEKWTALLSGFLPELRAKLKHQQVQQVLAAQLDTPPALASLLLNNRSLLQAEGRSELPAIEDFLNLEHAGLTADIYYSDETAGLADQTNVYARTLEYGSGAIELPVHPGGNEKTISGVWRGYLEAPGNGPLNFYVEADTDAVITLELAGKELPLTSANGVWQNNESVELQAGKLYEIRLVAKKIRKKLILLWEGHGLGKTTVPANTLYPAHTVQHFQVTYLRLMKAVTIAKQLNLSVDEVEHFAGSGGIPIDGYGWLNALPVQPLQEHPSLVGLLENGRSLLLYHRLKESLKIRDASLLQVLIEPDSVQSDGSLAIDRIMGWHPADRRSLLNHFGLTLSDLEDVRTLTRVNAAYAVIKQLRMGADTVVASLTNQPTAETVRALQSALRARYAPDDWLKVIQPINDRLRSMQRDALVVYILHQLGQRPDTAQIDTSEKLFEYFLIDVEMDPCMATSRIKQAISSVQLFVQRCLLNLENRVAPSSIQAAQWEWMKRYRVWEANRKIFLWPENWLEPELRDNKSPFFKELESELLQSDITDDAAAGAYVRYLEKLDEVAKLEVCGMCVQENESGSEADDAVHVVACTAGAKRNYYYRKFEFGTWTPWEKVDLNIEAKPVLPVVWRGRIFLFWTNVLVEPKGDAKAPAGSSKKNIAELTPSDLIGESEVQVKISLFWSEYVNGKWLAPRTSDVNKPLILGDFPPYGADAFDRSRMTLGSRVDSGALKLYVSYPGKPGGYFKLYNTHSLPIRQEDDPEQFIIFYITKLRTFSEKTPPFTIGYTDPMSVGGWTSFQHKLLHKGHLYEVVAPRHAIADVFTAPFFFQDRQHVFFVQPRYSIKQVGKQLDIWVPNPPKVHWKIPPTVTLPGNPIIDQVKQAAENFVQPGKVIPDPTAPFFAGAPKVIKAIENATLLEFNNRLIGTLGSLQRGDIGHVGK